MYKWIKKRPKAGKKDIKPVEGVGYGFRDTLSLYNVKVGAKESVKTFPFVNLDANMYKNNPLLKALYLCAEMQVFGNWLSEMDLDFKLIDGYMLVQQGGLHDFWLRCFEPHDLSRMRQKNGPGFVSYPVQKVGYCVCVPLLSPLVSPTSLARPHIPTCVFSYGRRRVGLVRRIPRSRPS